MTEQEILREIVALPGYFTKQRSSHHLAKAETAERDYNMVCDAHNGMSYTDMGKKYGLSCGRCRQLVARMVRVYIIEFMLNMGLAIIVVLGWLVVMAMNSTDE